MNFISLEYATLFCIVFVLYYLFPRLQIAILLSASLFFYGWSQPVELPLLLAVSMASSTVTYLILKDRYEPQRLMAYGIALNLLVLGFFKYKFLFIEPLTTRAPAGLMESLLYVPLPIGISFYTFHCISLIGDAYRQQFTKDDLSGGLTFSRFLRNGLLYLIFFPQIVAGPIVKAHQFMPQIGKKTIQNVPFAEAVKWIIWGLFFKSFVADNLAQFTVWMDQPATFQGLGRYDLFALLFCYSFQIFADFAGYSAIAIGSAALLGYRLPINFNRPYTARSFSDFWRRWHISLSSFLREYLYIPLGGNRHGPVRTYVNLFVTMALGGLWHGAAISFLLWGVAHGLALCVERAFTPLARNLPSKGAVAAALQIGYSGLIFALVSWLWLFFKLQNFDHAWLYIDTIINASRDLTFHGDQYALIAIYAAPVMFAHLIPKRISEKDSMLMATCYAAMLTLSIFDKGPTDAFIYFQF
ncbi:MBOAT family O-acyltransferase [Rhizobium laguerreae]|uniref:MBOAT family O-acyltransferase n=1 Tax=Rhizobium laguerreae TaxID=1076926 RepID=UPI001C924259|nr:MBOAT family O-acyltransferase [Rhizobium laguerreae]MBY3344904.1 MBOAT family protein [Rhizobium laguerreae]MBY3351938.1 MBOAT family protein [Rhizobium laguerreae]MBY3372611.1 MBOAT family protein [Rhizobium laguerreae]MBY3436788.1 MBOAT family protein [Rhizobium laguerreae]MBY3450930.1 MBOAT family protein [Rhizobium laguerreae]